MLEARTKVALVSIGLCACGARTELAGTTTVLDAGAPETSVVCQDEIIAQGGDGVGATALAVDGDDVFWFWLGDLLYARHAGVTNAIAGSPASNITSLAVDPQYVYYTNLGFVMRVPRAGGDSSEVAKNAGNPFAVAESGSDLFWMDYGAGIAAGSIVRNGSAIVKMLDTPGGLAVTDTHVFATCALAIVDQQSVMGPLLRASHDGSGLVAIAQGLNEPKGVVAFGGRVYFIEQTDAQSTLHGGVRSVDENGGAVQVEVQTDGYLPMDLAVDASGVYVTAYSQAESVLFHGNTVIAKTPGVFYEAVRTNASAIYWTITWTGTPPADHASVRKMCK